MTVKKAKILGVLALLLCLLPSFAFAANYAPYPKGISPSSGTSKQDQPVSFITAYTDFNGIGNISYVWFLVNNTINGANCFFGYYDQATNKLYIINDAGNTWLGGFTPGSAKTIENSYAKLDCSKTIVVRYGNTLYVRWYVTFKFTFTGPKNTYLYVIDYSFAESGWIQKGTWTIQSSDVAPPAVTITSPQDGAVFTDQ